MNARITWTTVALLLLMTLWNALTANYSGIVVTLIGIGFVVLPALIHHDTSVMPPWEIAAVLTITTLGYSLELSPVITQAAIYLSLITFAVLVVVELWVFSSVEMIPRFAGGFIVFAGMAAAGLWTVLRWLSDEYIGTAYLNGVTAMMWDLSITTVVSLLGIPLFVQYFKWHETTDSRGFGVESESESETQAKSRSEAGSGSEAEPEAGSESGDRL